MHFMYTSTRNTDEKATASQAILKGLAQNGGLFVPEQIPVLDIDVDTLAQMTYQETAYAVMSRFFTDFTEEELTFYWSDEEYQEFLEELKAYTG